MKLNEKGITIVALVIMIIIMIILAGVSITAGVGVLKSTKLQNINVNMLLIEAKAKTIAEETNFDAENTQLIGTKVSEYSGNKKVSQLVTDGIIENPEECYVLSKEDLNSMGLSKINEEAKYIVNYKTSEVIYVDGFEQDGKTYYKLSETKQLNIEGN